MSTPVWKLDPLKYFFLLEERIIFSKYWQHTVVINKLDGVGPVDNRPSTN